MYRAHPRDPPDPRRVHEVSAQEVGGGAAGVHEGLARQGHAHGGELGQELCQFIV
jgi:hypothetical protein